MDDDKNIVEFAKLHHEDNKRPRPAKPEDAWKKLLIKGKRGEYLSNVHNAIICLREASSLSGILSYDEMQCSAMVHALPGEGGFEPRPVVDNDFTISSR